MQVIVAGGGVAGATTALALGRIGAEVTVYEAYADPAGPVGSFLSLAANGLKGLRALGCLEAVQQAGFDVARQRLWADTGKLLGDAPRGRPKGEPLHSVTLERGRLVETLRACAADQGARFVTGERLTGAVRDGDGIRARFASGHTARADLLVGADGIWSATRRVLDPAAPEPAYAGFYSVSGVSRGVDVEPGVFNMVFGRKGAFIYLAAPGGEVWWSAQAASATPPGPDEAGLDDLRNLYRHEETPSALLRAATSVRRPTLMHALATVPVWHDDRIALVGDAWHPVGAGQGASMAIEDAVVLARCLAATGDAPTALSASPSTGPATAPSTTLATALAAYGQARRDRVARMLKAGDDNRDAKALGPVARRLRNLIMPVVFPFAYERATAWLYDHDPGAGLPPVGRVPAVRG
ncbi:FAD-dependent oxidoreductase [Microbispora triticiradicis]|uniref:FAD-dependent monooxygenase n=2 Tax=Microbispora TaxID=2005 RepID=A0ABY3LYV9_9ACTN|nr:MULTISPECIES: NAD(P)/FAD-dependent oxidoreductase [Microbispora]TLP63681.1 FAD-dependent monooxygenase [Microbispora fusca]TYB60396.1 FAD-dependent monooxygenase [Microbispora tritici]